MKASQTLPLLYLHCHQGVLANRSSRQRGLKYFVHSTQSVSALLFISVSQTLAHPRIFCNAQGEPWFKQLHTEIGKRCFAVIAAGTPSESVLHLGERLSLDSDIPIYELRLSSALTRHHYQRMAHFIAHELSPDIMPICIDETESSLADTADTMQTQLAIRTKLGAWEATSAHAIQPAAADVLLYLAYAVGHQPSQVVSLRFDEDEQWVQGFAWPRRRGSLAAGRNLDFRKASYG